MRKLPVEFMRRYLLILVWLCSSGAVAHITDTCLVVVEQSATALKECAMDRGQAGCIGERKSLTSQIDECLRQQFTRESIRAAILSGESLVKGTFSYYMPLEREAIGGAENWVKGNEMNFEAKFGGLTHQIPVGMDDNLNAGGCRQAFMGDGKHYLYYGALELSRYPIGEESADAKPSRYQLYLMVKMQKGQCYPVPQTGEKDRSGQIKVANLPEGFIRQLENQPNQFGTVNRVRICESESDCLQAKKALLRHQVDYQAAYLKQRRLQYCLEVSEQNSWLARIGRFEIDKQPLPDYCPADGLEAQLSRHEGVMQVLERKLFGSLKPVMASAQPQSEPQAKVFSGRKRGKLR